MPGGEQECSDLVQTPEPHRELEMSIWGGEGLGGEAFLKIQYFKHTKIL